MAGRRDDKGMITNSLPFKGKKNRGNDLSSSSIPFFYLFPSFLPVVSWEIHKSRNTLSPLPGISSRGEKFTSLRGPNRHDMCMCA